jgi:short-subunit dehydrogenase involved in D-alanine esterification of teichoic acids
MFAWAVEKYSTVDILVNNAGLLLAVGIQVMEDEQWWPGGYAKIGQAMAFSVVGMLLVE